jgi:tetratricopeptide (TPR) repeat protein
MVIGQYKIIEKIGEGGMGVIYKAEHCTLEQIVAIKALPETFSANPDLRERFIREAKIQAKLSHPNVVNIHNFFEFEGNYYIVMEYVEGETLEALIKTKGLLPPDSCIRMFKQILAGIGYAHSKEIIHRDVKPSNIMINKDGIVKITDFGIAKITGDMMKTQPGVKVGTIWYMSPEIVKGHSAGVSSDIYSLGVTLFEMITGNVPFSGNTEYTIMKNIVECPPPSPREFYPYVPVSLEKAILKAIAKEPAERFRSIEEFEAALKANPEDDFREISAAPAGFQDVGVERNSAGIFSKWKKQTIALSAALAITAALLFIYQNNGRRKTPSVASAEAGVVLYPESNSPKTVDSGLGGNDTRVKLSGLMKKAQTSLDKQDYKSAAAVYESALQIDKANEEARRGINMANKGLAEQKNRVVVRDYIATARDYHKNGNYGKAIDMFKNALRIDSGNRAARKGIEDAGIAWDAEERLGTVKR